MYNRAAQFSSVAPQTTALPAIAAPEAQAAAPKDGVAARAESLVADLQVPERAAQALEQLCNLRGAELAPIAAQLMEFVEHAEALPALQIAVLNHIRLSAGSFQDDTAISQAIVESCLAIACQQQHLPTVRGLAAQLRALVGQTRPSGLFCETLLTRDRPFLDPARDDPDFLLGAVTVANNLGAEDYQNMQPYLAEVLSENPREDVVAAIFDGIVKKHAWKDIRPSPALTAEAERIMFDRRYSDACRAQAMAPLARGALHGFLALAHTLLDGKLCDYTFAELRQLLAANRAETPLVTRALLRAAAWCLERAWEQGVFAPRRPV